MKANVDRAARISLRSIRAMNFSVITRERRRVPAGRDAEERPLFAAIVARKIGGSERCAMSQKSIVTSLLLVALAAGVSTAATDRRDFKDLAARTAIADEASKPWSNCPLSRAYVTRWISTSFRYVSAMDGPQWMPHNGIQRSRRRYSPYTVRIRPFR